MRSDAYDQWKLDQLILIQRFSRKFIEKVRKRNEVKRANAITIQKFIKGKQAK